MLHIEPVAAALAAAVAGVLVWASASDVRQRRIPNSAVLIVLGLFVAWSVFARGVGLISSLEAGAISFVAGYVLYALGVMGAGDVKLFAALSLFAGLRWLPTFAIATALAGGVLALGSLAIQPQRAMVILAMRGKSDLSKRIPYGVAISVGGLVVLWLSLQQGGVPH